MNLVLIGFMGVGKTSVGKRLAGRLGWLFIDTDSMIEEARSMTVAEIFKRYGEESFRRTEREVVDRVSKLQHCVIAAGGGTILDPVNTARLKECGLLVHLSLPLETICERIGHQRTRPLFHEQCSRETLEQFFRARDTYYSACCDVRLDRDGMDEDETVGQILKFLRSRSFRSK